MTLALAVKYFWALWTFMILLAVAGDTDKKPIIRVIAAAIQTAFLLSILFFWGA